MTSAFEELKHLCEYRLAAKNLTKRIEIINDSMETLTDEEQKILWIFATEDPRQAAAIVAELLDCDRETAYKLRNKASRKLNRAMFGTSDGGPYSTGSILADLPAATERKSATKATRE